MGEWYNDFSELKFYVMIRKDEYNFNEFASYPEAVKTLFLYKAHAKTCKVFIMEFISRSMYPVMLFI